MNALSLLLIKPISLRTPPTKTLSPLTFKPTNRTLIQRTPPITMATNALSLPLRTPPTKTLFPLTFKPTKRSLIKRTPPISMCSEKKKEAEEVSADRKSMFNTAGNSFKDATLTVLNSLIQCCPIVPLKWVIASVRMAVYFQMKPDFEPSEWVVFICCALFYWLLCFIGDWLWRNCEFLRTCCWGLWFFVAWVWRNCKLGFF